MREHAVTAALTVSFQRYPYPPSGWVETLPRSRGALPLAAVAPDRLLLACPPGEAFWVGLVATRPGWSSRVGVVARLASGERVDLATGAAPAGGRPGGGFAVPPRFAVEGIARPDGGWWPLALEAPGPAPACTGLELAVWTAPPAAQAPGEPGEPGRPRPLHDPADATGRAPSAFGPAGPARPSAPADPPAVLRVDLVDLARFEAATGRRVPPPSGEEQTYGGWRLP